MSEYRAVFGIDPHARTTTVCAVDASTGEVGARAFRGNPHGEMAERVAGSRSLPTGSTGPAAPASPRPGSSRPRGAGSCP